VPNSRRRSERLEMLLHNFVFSSFFIPRRTPPFLRSFSFSRLKRPPPFPPTSFLKIVGFCSLFLAHLDQRLPQLRFSICPFFLRPLTGGNSTVPFSPSSPPSFRMSGSPGLSLRNIRGVPFWTSFLKKELLYVNLLTSDRVTFQLFPPGSGEPR